MDTCLREMVTDFFFEFVLDGVIVLLEVEMGLSLTGVIGLTVGIVF